MKPALWLVVCVGCDRVFSLRPPDLSTVDASVDALIPNCSVAAFEAPEELPGLFQGETNLDPSFATPLELWTTRRRSTQMLFRQTRGMDFEPFDAGVQLTMSSANEKDPAFSADGRLVVYVHDDLVYQATRTSTAPTTNFDGTREIPGLLAPVGLDLSGDGKTLYYVGRDKELYEGTRASLTANFTTSRLDTGGIAIEYPSVSPDKLELFYNDSTAQEIRRMTRIDAQAPFDPATNTLVFSNAGDPDVSADGRQLVFVRENKVFVATRVCDD